MDIKVMDIMEIIMVITIKKALVIKAKASM